uniref:Uncharacterized protein n=1 Tax=Cannabis sativa TaxID=3483 RepID=A0A803PBL1_CANSA
MNDNKADNPHEGINHCPRKEPLSPQGSIDSSPEQAASFGKTQYWGLRLEGLRINNGPSFPNQVDENGTYDPTRVMANARWVDCFPSAEAIFLNEGALDHSPALVTFHQLSHNEKSLFDTSRCGVHTQNMQTGYKEFGSRIIMSAIIQARNALDNCQKKMLLEPFNQLLQLEELETRNTFTQAHKNYQLFVHQKVKTSWTRNGDDNTAIFHASIKARSNQNRILSIVDSQGTRVDDATKITEVFLAYYKQLLDEEIKKAMFAIPGTKAPGPDGYSSFFSKTTMIFLGVTYVKQ